MPQLDCAAGAAAAAQWVCRRTISRTRRIATRPVGISSRSESRVTTSLAINSGPECAPIDRRNDMFDSKLVKIHKVHQVDKRAGGVCDRHEVGFMLACQIS